MWDRLSKTHIELALKYFPAVVLVGARQVGKTTLALQIAKLTKKEVIHLDLELASDLRKLDQLDIFLETNKKKLIIVDEVQVKPEIFTALRPSIDRYRKNGRFILLGSANPVLIKGVSESLTGRAIYIDLATFSLSEVVHKISQEIHWFRGGYPRALLAKNAREAILWTQSYIKSYVERDLQKFYQIDFTPNTIIKILLMLASNQGGIFNASKLSNSMDVSSVTVSRYIDYLAGAFLIRILPPYYRNVTTRLVKSPKIYIRDTGILHTLLEIETYARLQNHITLGTSWEGYVIEQIIVEMGPEFQYYYGATASGAEIDLIICRQEKPIVSVEIKYSNNPQLTRGFFNMQEIVETSHNYIITPSSDRYHYRQDIVVCSLCSFLASEIPLLKKSKK